MDLSLEEHPRALEFLAINLSIRDRDRLIAVLCHNQPDLLTSTVRSLVTAYEPIIRALHKAVDLSGGVSDLQVFLTELIELSTLEKKPSKAKPSVEDFYHLVDKHVKSSHKFLHQACKNSPELREWYTGYAQKALSQYRQQTYRKSESTAAGDLTDKLQDLYLKLTPDEQAEVKSQLHSHSRYLADLASSSSERLRVLTNNLVEGRSETVVGPGIYLAKWQRLMIDALMTPEKPHDPPRTYKDTTEKDLTKPQLQQHVDENHNSFGLSETDREPQMINCEKTSQLLSSSFRQILEEAGSSTV